jgi:hypothetical protein
MVMTMTDYTMRADVPSECPFAVYPERLTVKVTHDSPRHGLVQGDQTLAWHNEINTLTLWTPSHFCEWSSGIACVITGTL